MQQVPAWLMVPLMVVVGPFVEEYIFRHLLIGKLSRRVNIWICCALSVVLFAALHIVGQEALTLAGAHAVPGHGRHTGVRVRVDRAGT